MPPPKTSRYHEAEKHLAKADPALKKLIAQVGPCTLKPNPDAFATLARSIISQQISTKAAESISKRVVALCGAQGLQPQPLLDASDEQIRSAGISTSKLLALRSRCTFFLERPTLARDLKKQTDEEVIETLLPIRGVGPWTAQMFLIFSLGRLDVLPVADLGFRAGVQDVYGLSALPSAVDLHERAAPWRPYRSVATWYMWRSRDTRSA
jgi:DNA-3-methyladenine glycosylase II